VEGILFKYRKEQGKIFLQNIKGKRSCFLCTIAHTETSSVPNISAAGATTELIKYTPAADVEAIYYGKAKCLPAVPENPIGPPSPVIISIASLQVLNIPFFAINAGVKVKPYAPLIEINNIYGENIENGNALRNIDIELIIEKSKVLAFELSKSYKFIILGESVPGGTTTAMSLINGLGYNSYNKICGSMPGNQHRLKIELVKKALEHINDNDSPVDIAKKIGDPMQIVQAFLTMELAKNGIYTLLAGGTQMVAVATLIKELGLEEKFNDKIAVATTKWVSEDTDSDIVGLMEEMELAFPLLSANLDFSKSKFKNLQLYEQGYVKEGVGAGGLAVAAFNEKNISSDDFLIKIEKIYEKIYPKK
jgi:uncharacterized protein (TIGR00303 family)